MYGYIQISLASAQKLDNVIPDRLQFLKELECKRTGEIKTAGNIRIYRPQVFRVMSGNNQSYSLVSGWGCLSPSSNLR